MSPTPRPLYAFALAVTLFFVGCDSAVPEPPSEAEEGAAVVSLPVVELRVPLLGAPAVDFLYDLAPLAVGGAFLAGLEFEGGSEAVLQSVGTADGVRLALHVRGLAPDSVTVAYLFEGASVARTVTHVAHGHARRQTRGADGDETSFDAGTSDSGPDSYHYEERDGKIVIVKDYKGGSPNETGRRRSAPGTRFVTAAGEHVEVTDVSFTLHGVRPGTPSAVRFASPSAFSLRWFGLAP